MRFDGIYRWNTILQYSVVYESRRVRTYATSRDMIAILRDLAIQ
jgi:hypothetical protein